MATTLNGRLRALASAHDLIRPSVASDNQGPHFTSVGALIERLLAAHPSSRQGQVSLDGPAILVGATGATSFALVLHEVAINAGKHGSLSLATGRVSIAWRIEEGDMVLTWIERGGCPFPACRGAKVLRQVSRT